MILYMYVKKTSLQLHIRKGYVGRWYVKIQSLNNYWRFSLKTCDVNINSSKRGGRRGSIGELAFNENVSSSITDSLRYAEFVRFTQPRPDPPQKCAVLQPATRGNVDRLHPTDYELRFGGHHRWEHLAAALVAERQRPQASAFAQKPLRKPELINESDKIR